MPIVSLRSKSTGLTADLPAAYLRIFPDTWEPATPVTPAPVPVTGQVEEVPVVKPPTVGKKKKEFTNG